MNFKKFDTSDNQWHDIPHYIHKTATDTLTLPATLYPNDTSITVGVKGNTVQNGTPTPQTPVDVVGVGELETSGEHSGQYKIPISSGGVTTNVYLGEVQSTRKIKKLVLTGQETWIAESTMYYCYISDAIIEAYYQAYSTHYVHKASYSDVQSTDNTFTIGTRILIHDSSCATRDDFKTYLQQQYANGTPVTVWYVLATPTTGIVNEPLRKIGNYADEVSGITIPTIAGKDSFDVLTTLKPSEVSLTYTGWHDATAKEWDGSEWQ